MTLVDDQQIDCVIRQERDGKLRYLDIQIKARSENCVPKDGGFFPAMAIRNPRENFYFIFYSEHAKTHWVMPSLDLINEANRNKTGANAGKYAIKFCNLIKIGLKPRPRFAKYENAFDLLKWAETTGSSDDHKI